MKWSIKTLNEWLIVALVFFGIMFGFDFIRGYMYFLSDNIHYLFNAHPTTFLLGIESIDAIAIFSGDEANGFDFNERTWSVFWNVIFYFFIGPFLLYLGFKNSNHEKMKPWYWYVGSVICLGSLLIVPTELLDIRVFENTKKSAEKSRINDLMRQELTDVSFAIVQYEILEDGLGEGFHLHELGLENLEFDYEIVNISSDTLIEIRISNQNVTDFSVIQEIRPYSKDLLRMRN